MRVLALHARQAEVLVASRARLHSSARRACHLPSEASVSEVSARMTKDDAAALLAAITPRPLAEWHEDDGVVLWWRFPVNEPPYVGTPLDDDWPVMATATGGTTNYATHWTRLLIPEAPR